jgi:hypothetical protein
MIITLWHYIIRFWNAQKTARLLEECSNRLGSANQDPIHNDMKIMSIKQIDRNRIIMETRSSLYGRDECVKAYERKNR